MAINLPPIDIQTTDKQCKSNEISAVYENAIELTTNMSFMRGMITAAILAGFFAISFFSLSILVLSIKKNDSSTIKNILIILGICWPLSLAYLRLELFTHLKDARIFNRKTQTVSIFRIKHKLWNPFASWPLEIETYPWNQVRARIEGGVSGNIDVPQHRCTLWLDILDKPDGRKVINKFPVGFGSGFSESRIALWEHIRRYMNGYGPAMQEDDKLWREDLSSPKKAFLDNFLPSHDPTRTVLNILFFPLALPIALSAALAVWTCKTSAWPQEILDAAGAGPLNDEQIQALIKAEKHLAPPLVIEAESKPLFARLD